MTTKTTATKAPSATALLTAEYNELARVAKIDTPAPKSKAKLEAAIAEIKASMKSRTAKRVPANAVAAADIAREMGLNAKVVRAKLRRLYAGKDANKLPKRVDADNGWFFAKGDVDRVHELLA